MASRVSEVGQITIDDDVRAELGIEPGMIAHQRVVDGRLEVVILPAPHRQSLFGVFRNAGSGVRLRYLLDDVPEQAQRARRLVESMIVLGITAVTLAEVAWTLGGPRYRIDRREVARVLMLLLARENVVTFGLDKSEAETALARCALDVGAANFGDALIAACSRSAGVNESYSFDLRFARAGLVTIEPPQ